MPSFWRKVIIDVIVRTITSIFRRKNNEKNKRETMPKEGSAGEKNFDAVRVSGNRSPKKE